MHLLGDPIFLTWMMLSAGFFFLGIFAFAIWLQVGGIRGMSLSTLALGLGLLTTLLGMIRAGEAARIPPEVITIGIRAIFPIMFLAIAVLVDAWSASVNDHRSITTITYHWFKRLGIERARKRKRADKLEEIADVK